MALTKTRVWNNTEPGKVAQAVIMGIRGTDGESYVIEADPASATGIPVSDAKLDVALSTRASEATQLLVKAKTDNLDVALSTRATEATVQKLREWPYATYNTQRLTQGALTDTWEFLNGVTVVGTIVITYTVANGPIDNVAYSPALAV